MTLARLPGEPVADEKDPGDSSMSSMIAIALGVLFALSVVVGLALAAMLGTISRAVTTLHEEAFEAEICAVASPTSRDRRPQHRWNPTTPATHSVRKPQQRTSVGR